MFERFKFTALKEGEEFRDGEWSFVADGSSGFGVPTIQLLFTHDLTTIWVHAALVYQEGDEDPDENE
jgi:hypothetical protein